MTASSTTCQNMKCCSAAEWVWVLPCVMHRLLVGRKGLSLLQIFFVFAEVSGEDRATKLVHTVLFRQLRRTLPAGNLAVRQVIASPQLL